MKNRRSNPFGIAAFSAPLIIALSSSAFAQLTWDPTVSAGATLGGSGTWDTALTNWWDGAANTAWDNTGATEAIFPDVAGNQTANIVDGGVFVGNLTVQPGTGKVQLKSVTDNLGVIKIKAGGATWNTGGREIEFVNDQANDTPLSIGTGDTLTITGDGQFDTGEKPTGAAWTATGATLDITSATLVRGNSASVGAFANVKMASGSTYVNERNGNQGYSNTWELGSGAVTFNTRWARETTLSGVISGTGPLQVKFGIFTENQQDFSVALNAINSFTGGVVVDGSNAITILNINAENRLGATPVSLDPDNITLKNGGYLRINGGSMSFDANRGITLDGGGALIAGSNPHIINGPITGTGTLEIGRVGDNLGNSITLTSTANTYTGETKVSYGTIALGVSNALPASTVLNLGGTGGASSVLQMNGFDQTIAGATLNGSNTREIRNAGATASTLTFNVPDTVTHSFGGNIGVSVSPINFVKTGLGTQIMFRPANYQTDAGDITVNQGTLGWDVKDTYGALTVNGGTLNLSMTGTTASFTAAAGSMTNYTCAITDWTGAEGTAWPLLTCSGDFSIVGAAPAFKVIVPGDTVPNFTDATTSFRVATVGGTVTAVPANFTVDASAFVTGIPTATGTWSLSVVGQDLMLNYTVGAADPYATWAATNITGGAPAGFNQDAENDGISNGMEFVLGGNPMVSDPSILPTTVLDATNLKFTYTRTADSKTSTTQTVQWSTDLSTWNPIVVPSGDPDTVTIDIPRANESGGKLFTRLNVVKP